jgi:hypothetical protein
MFDPLSYLVGEENIRRYCIWYNKQVIQSSILHSSKLYLIHHILHDQEEEEYPLDISTNSNTF